ncbi:hypothetical protein [Rubrolithibacter danxiaensis]|uniref:hypothetical protein n=1 Tax=Rubrolithibacter danxiaensis TaxID=3390805 RepID=UPI003BF82A17
MAEIDSSPKRSMWPLWVLIAVIVLASLFFLLRGYKNQNTYQHENHTDTMNHSSSINTVNPTDSVQ